MSLIRFLSYPVFFDPDSPRAVGYVMEHFWAIRSRTRSRRLLKRLVRPALPRFRKRGKERLEHHPRFERLRPYLEENTEVVIDARRFFRAIDFNRREVVNIFKGDDHQSFFENEVEARRRLAGFEFIPRLIEVDEDKKIFREEYVCERAFKSGSLRGIDAAGFARRLREIIRQVQGSAPVRVVRTENYVARLTGEILSPPEAVEEIRQYVLTLGKKASAVSEVELAFSHGDFRSDQLFFCPEGRIRILDWENSGYFSRCQDLIEFYVNEKWLYGNSQLPLRSFLEMEGRRLEAACSLYLLELSAVPVRIGRSDLLPVSNPLVRGIGKRMAREVPGMIC